MAAPRKYPEELRERAIRMVVDVRKDPATKPGALRRVGEQLGIHPETLRNWVNQAEVDAGDRPGTSTGDAARRLSRQHIFDFVEAAREHARIAPTSRRGAPASQRELIAPR